MLRNCKVKLKSGQNFVPHFLFLVANTLLRPGHSLMSLRENTSSKQDLHCKSWLELMILQSKFQGHT